MQGVGFRPYVYRLAHELELGGYVLNDARGVLLEVEGPRGAVDAFMACLRPRPRRWPACSASCASSHRGQPASRAS